MDFTFLLRMLRREKFAASAHSWEAEVFAVGKWKGKDYTTADLEQIAANFDTLKAIHKPPLKFGHDDAQQWFGQDDGAPALGWVSALRVSPDGQTLIARFTDVPDEVFQLVQGNRYRRVSSELYYDVPVDGKNVGTVLGAVALLGADLPEVNVLRDLTAYLHSDGRSVRATQFNLGAKMFSHELNNPRYKAMEDGMDKEELQRLLRETEDRLKGQFTAEMSKAREDHAKELEQYKAKEKAAGTRLRAEQFTAARRRVLEPVEKLVKAMKLTPALRDALEVDIETQRDTFTVDGPLMFSEKTVLALLVAADKGELGAKRAPVVKRTTHTQEGGDGVLEGADMNDAKGAGERMKALVDARLHQLKQANPEGKGLFTIAQQQISTEQPDLAALVRMEQVGFDALTDGEVN